MTLMGNSPIAVSPVTKRASDPSNIEFAISLTSARVGTGFSIIESSICVAITTGLPYSFAFLIMSF